VIGYRDIADTQVMIDTAKTHKHAVVIGGGLLGLEAANGLMLRGMHVTVVHLGEWLLERQLDKTSGQLLQNALEARGLHFRLCEQTQALHDAGNGRVGSVEFKNGDIIPADLVVMAAGIRPNTELAEQPASRAAGFWSTTPCKPTTRASTPLANAPAIAASPMAWLHRCSTRPRSAPITSHNWVSPSGLGDLDQIESHRHRPVFRR
jgi:glycine/D-amino acid oxidase-like deaminating enzyme